jgi:outer membrane protein insertion porin family
VQYKKFVPVQKGHNALGFNIQGSFISGFGGLVAPPFQRSYMGGENDLRGFDIRSVSPVAFLPSVGTITLTDPSGVPVPKDPQNPLRGNVTIPIPIDQITFPGGDLSVVTNFEYRITIYGPVALAPFIDMGIDPIVRKSQLQIATQQYNGVVGTAFGCPTLSQTATANTCSVGNVLMPPPSKDLQVLGSTNWRPRMSTGLELQMFLPVINAPFRIYWAYNPLRLDSPANPPIPITRAMFPSGGQSQGAGDYTFALAKQAYSPSFLLREPRKTFRFTVATTF